MKIALITGITGQDGSYLSELLLSITDINQIDNIFYKKYIKSQIKKLNSKINTKIRKPR